MPKERQTLFDVPIVQEEQTEEGPKKKVVLDFSMFFSIEPEDSKTYIPTILSRFSSIPLSLRGEVRFFGKADLSDRKQIVSTTLNKLNELLDMYPEDTTNPDSVSSVRHRQALQLKSEVVAQLKAHFARDDFDPSDLDKQMPQTTNG